MGTISDKLTYLNETKNLLKTQINYGLSTEEQITSSTTFRKYVSSIFNAFLEALRTPDTLFTNLPKKSGSGSIISLNDTANAPMRITLGASELTQDGTPTPSSPQAVHTISGSNKVKVNGKNLLDISNPMYTNIILRPTGIAEGVSTTSNISQYIKVKPNTTYYLSTVGNDTNERRICYYKEPLTSEVIDNTRFIGFVGHTGTGRSFTTPNECNYIRISYYISATSIQLELGNTATTYTPYVLQEAEVNLSSKNLFDVNNFNTSYSNLTLYRNNNKLTLNGTASALGSFNFYDNGIANYVQYITNATTTKLKAGNYTISLHNISGTQNDTYCNLLVCKKGVSTPNDLLSYFSIKNNETSTSFTLNEESEIYIGIQWNSGKVFTNYSFDIQLEKNNQATSYEPYYDYGECGSIGDYENIPIRTSGKNLFDKDTFGTFPTLSISEIQFVGKPNTTYTMSSNLPASSGNANLFFCLPNESFGTATNGILPTQSKTITTGLDGLAKIGYRNYQGSVSGDLKNDYWFMLNEGTTALDYEPYGSNEWYIKKNIEHKNYNGSETWDLAGSYDTYIICIRTESNMKLAPLTISNRFETSGDNYLAGSTSTQGRVLIKVQNDLVGVQEGDNNTQKRQRLQTWLSNNNTDFFYQMLTPTYTPITGTLAEQLENVYQKLLSYSGTTNISQVNNDLSFNLSVQAIEEL